MPDFKVRLKNGLTRGCSWGKPKGIPILAIHGWLDNAHSFLPLAKLLPEFHWLALDLPGHGKSGFKPAGNIYHFIDWVADLWEVIHHFRWKEFYLVGHSLGASIAVFLPGLFPDKIKKLLLLDGLGPMTNEPEELPKTLKTHLAKLHQTRNNRKFFKDLEDAAKHRMEKGELNFASAQCLANRGVVKSPQGYYWRYDPQLTLPSPVRLTENHVKAVLHEIQCPTLFLYSNQAELYYQQTLNRRKHWIKKLTAQKINGSHHFHLDDPEGIAEIVKEFFMS
ncbi:MAG: alpha/beta hydrolase [Deltaproteobacteria bacterium]|nr:alpha/beta hydrolase [Deltaproteobacteria bacterium]